ncbi:LpxI family protein [Henriciella sp.]|uniref:LpxI family protein n=1 Tax=Henriciella sp. TaxID=1968823 RepID=UPI00261058A7|nr:UDP-2,3-diacylglucosamine diphosphatase LpxI [Henriciella sp.]
MSKLAIIAGLGDLPVSIAQAAKESGRPFHIFRLSGFEEKALVEFPGETIGMGQVGRLVRRLKQEKCDEVVFAGIVKRPNFTDIKLDLRGARLLPRVLKAARQGDDALLRVVVTHLEKEGFRVVAAEDAAKDLLAGGGLLFGNAPGDAIIQDMKKAASIAAEIGRLDIGQGCVVVDGLVLAVEAQEGTDAMLDRVCELEASLRGNRQMRKGVLVKRPKPIQERRIDLPVIGPGTIRRVSEAGLAGIGLEEDGALLLGRDAIDELCETHGVFVYGFPADWS